jgi:hypothetical protein
VGRRFGLIAELQRMQAAIMELTEEESAVGDTAVSMDPLEDDVPM